MLAFFPAGVLFADDRFTRPQVSDCQILAQKPRGAVLTARIEAAGEDPGATIVVRDLHAAVLHVPA